MTSSMLRRQLKNLVQNYSEAEVKVREATSNDPWGPSSTQMADISDLTYNVVACNEIMTMLWKRLKDDKNWRHIHKSLTLLEYLLKTGDDRVLLKMKDNIYIVKALTEYRFVEKDGKDQGVNVREKAKVVLVLMEDDEKLKEERDFAVRTREKTSKGSAASSTDNIKDPNYMPCYVAGSTGLPSLDNIPSVADLTASFAARKEERLKQEFEKKETERRAKMSEEELKWEDAGKKGDIKGGTWGGEKEVEVEEEEEEVTPDPWGAPKEPKEATDPWGTPAKPNTTASSDPWAAPTESVEAPKVDEDSFVAPKNAEDPFAAPKDKPDPFSTSDDDPFYAPQDSSDPFKASKVGEDPFTAPKDKPDPFSSSSNDPFNAPKDDPFNAPKNDPFNALKDDPFNTPKDDPFNAPKDDPFNTPKDDPFNAPKDDPFTAPASTSPKEDPFAASASSKGNHFTASTTPPKEDPFSAPKRVGQNDPFAAPTTPPKKDPFSVPPSPPKGDASDPFNASPRLPQDSADTWDAPTSSPPATGSDPWGATCAPKETKDSDPWGHGTSASSPIDNSDAFGDASKPDNDPWGAPVAAPAGTDDAWGSPAPPFDSSPSGDPFGDGTSKKGDPWGAPSNASSNGAGKQRMQEDKTYRKTASFLGSAGASLVDLDDLFSSNPKLQQCPLVNKFIAQTQAIGAFKARGMTSGPVVRSGAVAGVSPPETAIPYCSAFGSTFAPSFRAANPSGDALLFQLPPQATGLSHSGLNMPQAAQVALPRSGTGMVPSFSMGGSPQMGLNMNPSFGGVGVVQSGSLMRNHLADPLFLGTGMGQSGLYGGNRQAGVSNLGGSTPQAEGRVPFQPQLFSGSQSGEAVNKNNNPFLF